MFDWAVGNGWVGVALGVVMFGLGFYKGRYDRAHMEKIAGYLINDLVRQRFIRTRKVYNPQSGEWELDLLEWDYKENK